MAVDGKILSAAEQRLAAARSAHQNEYFKKRESIYGRCPRLREIDRELQGTMGKLLSRALRRGTDPSAAIKNLRTESLDLQEEKKRLLEQMGFSETELRETPLCEVCNDKSAFGGEMCVCLRRFYAQEQQRELSRMLDLQGQSFDSFRLDYYPNERDLRLGCSSREHMSSVFEACRSYAANFGKSPENLLLFGEPGLGKTFLSAAIAREVSAGGWSVVYDTAVHVFECFEADKFRRNLEDTETGGDVARILHCDLLILDDLGTELNTTFVQSALYQIVNTRLLDHRSTIISTNLNPSDIGRRYTPQTASRIEGEYEILAFFGEDIRRLRHYNG